MATVEQIERERAERKEALAARRAEQRAVDLEALNALEIELGDENVWTIDVGRYSPGLVTLVAGRALNRNELKRWRDQSRGERADAAAAAELAAECVVRYPAQDAWRALCEAVPGIAVRVGVAAVQLAAGLEQSEGKG